MDALRQLLAPRDRDHPDSRTIEIDLRETMTPKMGTSPIKRTLRAEA